jgi:autotransporter-associated beta strand protein
VTAASAQMNAGVGGMVGLTKTGAGTLTLGVPPGYSGVTTVSAGQLTLDGADLTQSSALNVATGATFALVSPNFDTVVNTTSYSIAGTGRIDLTDNKLISNNAAGTESGGLYSGVQGDVQRASNGGAWNQPGLTTSLPDAVIGRTSIGVATGAQIRGLGPTATAIFAGQTITGVSTVAMYTYAGDANLDGLISGDDYSAIDFNVAIAGADGWVNGDFNYDGVISGDDYSAIDFNIVAQGSPFPTGAAASSLAAVPEPAAISVLVATVAYLLPPRSRRRR